MTTPDPTPTYDALLAETPLPEFEDDYSYEALCAKATATT